jgi:hypothetical protein
MKSNLVVVQALVDDVIWLALEPNHSDSVVPALHQGERHVLAMVLHRAAPHAALIDLDVRRGTWGRRLDRQLGSKLLLHHKEWWRQGHTSSGARCGGAHGAAWGGGGGGRSSRAVAAAVGHERWQRRRLGLGAKQFGLSVWVSVTAVLTKC